MLEGIGWNDYLFVVAAILLVYYPAIGLLYYRQDLKMFLARSGGRQAGDHIGDSSIAMMDSALDEAQQIMRDSGKVPSEELLARLQPALKQIALIREEVVRNIAIDKLVQKSNDICGVRLLREELEAEMDV